MLKRFLLSLASLFLGWQSVGLVAGFRGFGIESLGGWLLLAAVLNLFVLGAFAFAGFAHPTQRLLPRAYYRIHDAKRLKRVCKVLGVDHFRSFLLATFWRNKDQQKRYFDGTRAGLAHLAAQSEKSEFGHLIPAVLITGLSVYFAGIGYLSLAVAATFWNVLANVYPILLQRHHRMRLARLARIRARKPAELN